MSKSEADAVLDMLSFGCRHCSGTYVRTGRTAAELLTACGSSAESGDELIDFLQCSNCGGGFFLKPDGTELQS